MKISNISFQFSGRNEFFRISSDSCFMFEMKSYRRTDNNIAKWIKKAICGKPGGFFYFALTYDLFPHI